MKLRFKSIFWGLLLVLIAAGLILRGLGMIDASFPSVIFGVILLAILVNSIIDLTCTGILFSLSALVVIFRSVLPFEIPLEPWVIIVAASLAGIGLDIIFKGPRKKFQNMFSSSKVNYAGTEDGIVGDYDGVFADAHLKISNTFGDQTEYVRSNNLETGKIENSFGSLTVYLDQVTLKNDTAWLKIKNGFGKMVVHIPSSFRVELTKSNGFGNIQTMGQSSTDPNAPLIHIEAENGFGDLTIRCY